MDTASGKEVWRQEAAGLDNTWGTPALVQIDKNRTDLVVGVPYEIWGINPDNGKLRWYYEATGADQANSSVVLENGIAYIVTVRGGGFGSSDYASPIIAGNKLYYLNSNGEMFLFSLGDNPDQLSVNKVTEDRETFGGTPAVSQGRLFIRSNKHLYCVAQE